MIRRNLCRAKLHKPKDNDDSRHFIVIGQHLHLPDNRKIAKKRAMNNIKEMAKNTLACSSDIIAECLKDTKKASLAIMPPPKQLRELVSRTRMDPELKANPNKLSDVELTDKFCKTNSGESFLLFDSGPIVKEGQSEKRLIIFGTEANLKFLAECNEFFMDGTFTIAPKLFNQLYTIHGKKPIF